LFLLMLVTVAALIFRIGVAGQLARVPAVSRPPATTDMATYARLARDFLDGKLPDKFYYQPFYYTVFLPAVYLVAGRGPWGVILAQSFLGALTVLLVGLTAARTMGRRAGLAGAVFLAFYRLHVFYTPFQLMAVFNAFLVALWSWLCLRAWRLDRGRDWIGAALVAAAAILTRGNFILLTPGLFGLLWLRRRGSRRFAVLALICFALLFVPQLPFSVYNFRRCGRWTGPSTAADAVLALGNTPEAPPAGLDYPPTYEEWMRTADRTGPDRIPVSRRILAWVRREPLAFLELKFRMLLAFWWRSEVPNNVALAREGKASTLLQMPLLFGFGAIGALALAGMMFGLCKTVRSPPRLFLLFSVWAYCAATIVFYVLARFRLPVVPLLCVFAGSAVDTGIRLVERRSWRYPRLRPALWRFILAVCLGAFVTTSAFPLYRERFEAHAMLVARPDGVTVSLPTEVRIYDHGPVLFGGWTALPLPPGGLEVRKTFRLPEGVSAAALPGGEWGLRIPFYCENPTPVSVRSTLPGAAPSDTEFELPGGRLVWRRISAPVTVTGRAAVISVRIDAAAEGAAIFCDRLRWYGRTRWRTPGKSADLPIRAEACFELVVPKPAGGPSAR